MNLTVSITQFSFFFLNSWICNWWATHILRKVKSRFDKSIFGNVNPILPAQNGEKTFWLILKITLEFEEGLYYVISIYIFLVCV